MSLEISIVLRTSLVLACAASIAMIFGRRCSAAGRHRIWLIAVWAALALPAISFLAPKVEVPILPAPQVTAPAPESPDIGENTIVLSSESSPVSLRGVEFPAPATVRAAAAPGRPWSRLLLAVWGFGSLIVLVRAALGLWEVQHLRQHSIVVQNQRWETQLQELRAALGVPASVQLRVTGEQIPPVTWGVFRPVILIPSASSEWTEERRRLVLAHELSHVKRNDGRTQIVVQLACSLYWFNPLVWYAGHRIRVERERACDDLVLSLGAEAEDYADHLLQIARTLNSGLSFATVSIAHRAYLETRLRAILDPFTRRKALGRAGSVAVLAFVAALTMITAVLQLTALAPMILRRPAPPSFPISLTQPVTQNSVSPSQLTGLASVAGSVEKMGSGEALPGTRVELQKFPGGGEAAYSTFTATDGSFVFSGVQPGEYRVIATRDDGMLPAEYKQKSPNVRGMPIPVHPADTLRDIRLAMAPPGAISGRVFDHDGEPVGNAQVQALKVMYRSGRRMLSIAESVQTNDIGEYRLFWLAPGQYYVTAKPIDTGQRSASMYIRPPSDRFWHDETSAPAVSSHISENGESREEVHPLSYYPGTPDFNAARPLALNPGDNLTRMDITVSALVPARHIRGTVIDGATGQPAAGASLRAIPRDGNPSVVVPNATSDARGGFNIAGVAPGSYYLFATAARNNNPIQGQPSGASGRLALEVGSEDLQNVGITVPVPFDISGRVVFEGKTNLDFDMTRLKVSLQRDPDILGMPFAQPITRAGTQDPNATQPDGAFALAGIGPGDYRVFVTYTGVTRNAPSVGLSAGTYLKSIRFGNVDALNGGLRLDARPENLLEITIGATEAEIGGSVVNAKSEAVPNALIVLLPDSALRHRDDLYKTAGTGPSGQFTIRNIAPGEYTLFAFEDIEPGSWFDPEFLKTFETRGMRMHITETTMESRQLVVIDAGR
jgi:beta-lactamase regulating signal transducer with metallopeptidase domain